MPLVADRVKETTTTAGTGTLTLAGAATGFQSFSAAFGTGAVVYYVIAAGADWEIGIGTTGSGTLSRDTVLQSSNGDALVDWPAGTKDVFCAYVADRAVTTSDPATLTNKTIDDYTNNVGANSTHFRIKAGATLAKGDVVKAVGFTPGEQAIEVVKVASSTDVALGICEQALNTGNFGLAVVIGELFNVNTNGFTVGETLYSNGSGGFTATKPSSGLYQVLGWVVRANASNGVIAVNVVAPLYVEASTNTVNTAVIRDGSGNFAAGTITAALTGNASTATALSSSRTFALTGDVTGSVSSDLTSGASISTAIAAGVIVDADINASAAIADTKLATISTAGKVSNSATTAASASTGSAIVARDANGSASFKNVKLDGTTSGTVTVQPAAVAGTWSLTLPTTAGSSGQVLSTDGSGVTSWATVGGQTVVNTTSSYNLSAADAGKLIVYTGTSTANVFYAGAALASGLTTGQSIDIANNSQYGISVGGAQVFDSTYANVPWATASATITAIYPNGKILVATNTTLQRFNADGTADNTFTTITPGSTINSIAISSDGSAVFVAGNFTQVTQNGNTVQRNYVVKLNGTTGIIDTSFVPFSGLNNPVYSVAVSGTTVAVSFSGSYRLIAFMNSTTGADLGGSWTGQYGGTDCFGFQSQPLLKQNPTIANTFIAFASNGYYYIDYEGTYTYFNAPVFLVQSNGGQSYTASNGTSVPQYQYGDAVLITSTHIYWAAYTGYFATVYRLTIGTYSSGLVSNNWNAVNSTPVSVFSRTTDGSIFVGTTALIVNGAASSVFNFPANLASVTALPVVTTITSGGSGVGVLGQSLSNGSLLLCNVVVANTNIRIAKTVVTFESAATIAYPPYQNGQFQATGFTATTEQNFRTYQTMRLQKMSNGQLLVTQRNTPYQ